MIIPIGTVLATINKSTQVDAPFAEITLCGYPQSDDGQLFRAEVMVELSIHSSDLFEPNGALLLPTGIRQLCELDKAGKWLKFSIWRFHYGWRARDEMASTQLSG